MALMFTQTASIKKAVSIINSVDNVKYARILARILQKIHLTDERPFSEEEEEKLQVALSLEEGDIHLILETTAFIVEQAAYHLAKPAVLSQQLQNIGLSEEKVAFYNKIWLSSAKDVVERLKQKTLVPNQLQDVNWRLNLQMAQSDRAKLKTPNAQFELVVSEEEGKNDRIRMEFNHQELYAFYNQLETIQGQLDALS